MGSLQAAGEVGCHALWGTLRVRGIVGVEKYGGRRGSRRHKH